MWNYVTEWRVAIHHPVVVFNALWTFCCFLSHRCLNRFNNLNFTYEIFSASKFVVNWSPLDFHTQTSVWTFNSANYAVNIQLLENMFPQVWVMILQQYGFRFCNRNKKNINLMNILFVSSWLKFSFVWILMHLKRDKVIFLSLLVPSIPLAEFNEDEKYFSRRDNDCNDVVRWDWKFHSNRSPFW